MEPRDIENTIAELDFRSQLKTEKQVLDLFGVRNSIQNRIQKHNEEISLFRNIIKSNLHDTKTIQQYTDLIKSKEISIQECEKILEYCF